MNRYAGSCHCGAVQFEIVTDIKQVIACNCSICTKKGALHHRVRPEQFTLITGEEFLVLYQFNTKQAKHYFCKKCGIHPFSRPRIDPQMYSINVRCLKGVNMEEPEFELVKYDGINLD